MRKASLTFAEKTKKAGEKNYSTTLTEEKETEAAAKILEGRKKLRQSTINYIKSGIKYIDFKNAEFLMKFVNDQGKLLPRRLTGTSLKYQRKVAEAVKRARHLAILPFIGDQLK